MKKISNLFIGTNNKGKLKEIQALLPKRIKIYSILDLKIKSPIENGKSFDDNSIIKSKYFSKKTNLPCLADDSGLEIDILDKAPGIFSSRWAGKNSDSKKAIQRVYRELDKKDKNWKRKKIRARFVCSLSLCFLEKKIACVKGKIEGMIATEPRGNNGFGYDPIFIPNGKKLTFGEIPAIMKYKIDHRFNAFKKIKKFL